jgi:diaminohydroxyphosphoribosylaminopyrimidine deaminase / 5-amino-6-(5-phosphoribosylamino)uracil reductase
MTRTPATLLPPSTAALGALGELARGVEARRAVVGVLGVRADNVVGRRSECVTINARESLTVLHALRAEHDAVVVGRGTVAADNPRLTVRHVTGSDPIPVVADTHASIDADAVLATPRTVVCCGSEVDRQRRSDVDLEIVALGADGRLDLTALLDSLGRRGLTRVLVEGGPSLLESFAVADLLDAFVLLRSPRTGARWSDEVVLDTTQSWFRDLVPVRRTRFGEDEATLFRSARKSVR